VSNKEQGHFTQQPVLFKNYSFSYLLKWSKIRVVRVGLGDQGSKLGSGKIDF
jgi:hypothetical protein